MPRRSRPSHPKLLDLLLRTALEHRRPKRQRESAIGPGRVCAFATLRVRNPSRSARGDIRADPPSKPTAGTVHCCLAPGGRRIQLAVPPENKRLWGAIPGKHGGLGPEPLSGHLRAAVSDWQRRDRAFCGSGADDSNRVSFQRRVVSVRRLEPINEIHEALDRSFDRVLRTASTICAATARSIPTPPMMHSHPPTCLSSPRQW
jgi:hypothetical protein